MDDKKYVCIRDFEEHLLGKVKTIDEWKSYIIDDRKKALEEVFSTTDKDYIDQMNEVIQLKENEVIPYIRDVWDVKLVPLEDAEKKYIILDECKLVNELTLRRILLEEETRDILANSYEYISRELDLNEQLKYLKTALDGNIDDIIYWCNTSWNIPVVKIEGV